MGLSGIPGASAPSHMYLAYGCVQNGPPARRSEPDWRKEGAYLNRYVTDEQRSRRPIFNATLRAAAICQLHMRRRTRFQPGTVISGTNDAPSTLSCDLRTGIVPFCPAFVGCPRYPGAAAKS